MELIYNQTQIPKEQWRYGMRSSAAVGCGWVATYNALVLLGKKPCPEKLIAWYERQLPLIHGNFGTGFWVPGQYFKKLGYRVTATGKRSEMDRIAGENPVCILYYHWKKGIKIMGHFVALHKTEDGFIAYNTFKNSHGPDRWGQSIDGFLTRHKYFGARLYAIREAE